MASKLATLLLVTLLFGQDIGCFAQVARVGKLLDPNRVLPASIINSDVGSIYIVETPIGYQGIVLSFQAYFSRSADVTLQIWRPVTSGTATGFSLLHTRTFTVDPVDANTLVTISALDSSPCLLVEPMDRIGVYVSQTPSPYLVAYDIPSGRSLLGQNPLSSHPVEGQEVTFDAIVFPITVSMRARVYIGPYNNGTTENCDIVPELRQLLASEETTTEEPATTLVPTLRGEKGQQGARGDRGPAGAAGPPGARGAPGSSGFPGASGLDGLSGLKGDPGVVGAAGASGATGSAGAKGDTGESGTKGEQGLAGNTGERGLTGATGSLGGVGPPGPPGPVVILNNTETTEPPSETGASRGDQTSALLTDTMMIVVLVWHGMTSIVVIVLIIVIARIRKAPKTRVKDAYVYDGHYSVPRQKPSLTKPVAHGPK